MANKLYIISTESRSGKSIITLGLMQLIMRHVQNVAFFRPIIGDEIEQQHDHHINLILQHFKLTIPYKETYASTFSEARALITAQKSSLLIEKIIQRYSYIEDKYDFVLCEGTDYLGKEATFELELNAEIAANLNIPIALVINGKEKSVEELISSTLSAIDLFVDREQDIACVFINRTTLSDKDITRVYKKLVATIDNQIPISILPEDHILGQPTMSDIMDWTKAQVVSGKNLLHLPVQDYITAAMKPENFLTHLKDGMLVITPGDRSDIVLASFASRLSATCPNIAGILLTGALTLSPAVLCLIEGLGSVPIPILTAKENTYQTILMLSELYSKIAPSDTRKINTALYLFDRYADNDMLSKRIIDRTTDKVSPKMFEFKLIEQARQHKMRIVLPEGTEERILKAAEALTQRGVAEIILLGNSTSIYKKISSLNLSLQDVTIIQPDQQHPLFESYIETYYDLRKHKGITIDDARDYMSDATYFATMMVYKNDADGMVSGSIHTTAHTIRPALEIIKTKPHASIVSSVFLMCMKDHILVFGDCAVNPNPTAEQLADIAISSAHTAQTFGITPRIAMLSYSTGSSGKGIDVDIVTEATQIVQKKSPYLIIDGPIQYDAAIDPHVAHTKAPTSPVAGKATVFIFPDLNTGNNTYKAVQRAADAVAIGPILQGLNKPVNDLSRGCTIADIINTVSITAIQAQAEKGLITLE